MNSKGLVRQLAVMWLLLFGTAVVPAMPTMSLGSTAGAPGTTNPGAICGQPLLCPGILAV